MSKKEKNFVIDTNVLLFDPEAIFRLDDNNVIIPDVVLEELDHFKSEKSDRGSNSRKVSRYLDNLRNTGSMIDGVSLGEGKGILKIAFTKTSKNNDIKFNYELDKYDNRILYLCVSEKKVNNYILITKDVNLRVKASTVGVKAEDYKNDKIINKDTESYTGRTTVYFSNEVLDGFKKNENIPYKVLMSEGYLGNGDKFNEEIFPNEFFEMYPIGQSNPSAMLGRFDGKNIVPLKYANASMKGINPRNVGQYFMKEALMQPASVAPLVIIKGIAGTGKTLFALAAGLENYCNDKTNTYNRILICRPSVTMDEDIGYLPGSEKEKISPYMRAIKDNVFTIYNGDKTMSMNAYQQAEGEVENLFDSDFIKTEALAYQRGRSLNRYWFIVDEMQNSSIRQAKGIVTRGGKNTKIILLGDPDQIDSPYLDSQANGLTYASEKMKGSKLCWQVTMNEDEGERSPLAEEAAKRM